MFASAMLIVCYLWWTHGSSAEYRTSEVVEGREVEQEEGLESEKDKKARADTAYVSAV